MKRILVQIGLVVLLLAGCSREVSSLSVSDYSELLQKVKKGSMDGHEEIAALTQIKEGILTGKVTMKDLDTSKVQIDLLTRVANLKFRSDCESRKIGLDPKSQEYLALQWIIDDIDRTY